GLGFVVVKALGGEEVKLPNGTTIARPASGAQEWLDYDRCTDDRMVYVFPEGCKIHYVAGGPPVLRSESFGIAGPNSTVLGIAAPKDANGNVLLPSDSRLLIPGSAWGTFTIACTIPIALFVAFWIYRLRKGHVVEASAIGAVGVLFATVAGGW